MIYLFECKKCGIQEEKEISIKKYDEEKGKQECKCGGKMERVFTPIGATEYKCGGFYDTDCRNVSTR